MGAALVFLALCETPGIAARAQETAKPQPVKMMPKDADPDWEVATVKPSDPNEMRGQHILLQGRRVELLDTTVEQFLLLGYSVQKSQLANEPAWVTTQRWDVDGVPDVQGEPSLKQLQAMIRKILAERFGLKLHHEQRELAVFALIPAKGGPKLVADTSDPNGWMDQQNGESDGRHVEALKNASMGDLALILQFHVDRPIIDQTGLKGRYDFKLQWSTDDAPTTATDALPGLFTAIQDQIGLKLERVKAPADVLVIDTVERPGAN
ncbi:MAG: TIGR03435 family protein [Acidobacteriaceae bacterium]